MVLSAAVMWGTTGTARALAPAGASPLSVGAVRIAIGGGLLVAIAAARGTLRTRWPIGPTVGAAAAVAVYQLAFFEGVARAGVAPGTIVAIGSAPVFAGVLAWLVLGERPSTRWIVATALAVVGVALLSLPRSGVALEPLTLALPLVSGLGYAIYATVTKMLLPGRDNVAVAAVAFGGGALLLVPVLALSDLHWVLLPAGAIVALELGVVATALAYILFTRALTRLPVSWGATLSLAEPLTASLLGVVVLGEALGVAQLAGAALVAVGLVSLATAPGAS
jgi:drug/metabolite transporter, DME family